MSEKLTKIGLTELEAKFFHSKGKQETLFFRGKEGIKEIFEDQIREGKDVYIIGASHNAKELLRFYIPHYTNKRIKKKIKLHALYAGKKHDSPVPLAEVRYLPESFSSLVSTNIYGDKVAILVWSDEPVAILIKDKAVSQTYRKYFAMLWEMEKE